MVEQAARSHDGLARRMLYRLTTRWTRRYEERMFRQVAGVWAVSDLEAIAIRAAGAPQVWVVPNGVTLPINTVPAAASAPSLLFVGSMHMSFNRDAVAWFLEACWPEIRESVPEARLVLAGRGGETFRGPGVEALGYVDDLAPLYAGARACIAPLRAGAGTRLKVIEAMAHARAVVSTPVGCEGLAVSADDGVVAAEGAASFARECIGLLSDKGLAAELGGRARRSAERFSWTRPPPPRRPALSRCGLIVSSEQFARVVWTCEHVAWSDVTGFASPVFLGPGVRHDVRSALAPAAGRVPRCVRALLGGSSALDVASFLLWLPTAVPTRSKQWRASTGRPVRSRGS